VKTKEILLINDDSIHSPGLLALKKKMEELDNVVVVAPETEKSGTGKAVSTGLIKVEETMLADGTKAYAIDGTPADACLLALFKILKQPPSLVVSGINLGPNLGVDDLFTSGTLGAALEAAIHKIPAIAVSYSLERIRGCEGSIREKIGLENLELCAELAKQIAEYILRHGMPEDVDLLSINFPEKLSSKVVEVTNLSYEGYADIFSKKAGGYKIRGWVLKDYSNDKAGTDLHAVRENRHISITPIKLNFIHQKQSLEELAKFLGEREYEVKF
jgi:5'-nucleotidase